MSKSTVSEAKRAANARNGKRGGPKTPAGKARTRLNGLKHGHRSQALPVLPGEDAEAFALRLEAWTRDLQPKDDVERYHVEAAVAASWRRDRCIRAETAELTDRVLDAAEPDPEVAIARAERLGARLASDPAAVAHELRKTAAGCSWMLARWDDLADTLSILGYWEHTDLTHALNLAGRRASEMFDVPLVSALVVDHISARWGTETTPDSIKYVLRGGARPGLDMGAREFEVKVEAIRTATVSREEGRAGLEKVVAECRAELEERLEWAESVEARRHATAADRASFDDSAAGQKRQRYEAMHDRTLRLALRDLRAAQALRLAQGDDAGTTAAPSEPTEATDPLASAAESMAPSEPTEAPAVAPSEPTEVAERVAPSEPTEAAPSNETSISGSLSGDREEPVGRPDRAEEGSAGGPIAGPPIAAEGMEEAGVPDPTAGEGSPGGPAAS